MSPKSPNQNFRLILLTAMVLQNASVVLIGRHTRASAPQEDLYNVSHLIMTCEIVKFVGACVLEFFTFPAGKTLMGSLKIHVFDHPMDCLRIAVPAGLYLLQNTLLYVALSNLSAPLFQVTYQSKLLTTAIVSVFLLNRTYARKQWIALFTLGVGVALAILSENKKGADAEEGNMVTGLAAVIVACLSSALAGVYTEMILKNVNVSKEKDPNQPIRAPPSLWMRNIQMAFISICIAYGKAILYPESGPSVSEKTYFFGFTFWVWILVGLQAGGGLLIAAIIKYADNVLKGLATGVAVVVSTLCSTFFFGTPLTFQFVIGATLILSSVYVFSTSGASNKPLTNAASNHGSESGNSSESEMKSLVSNKV